MAVIKKIKAYEIIDSSGFPTIEARLFLDTGQTMVTSVPAGTSIGKYEAAELRDRDPAKFDGMGVTHAVYFINELIGPKLMNVSPLKQFEIDAWLVRADNTKNKSKLGANTMLAVSQLIMKAGAVVSNLPLFRYVNSLFNSTYKTSVKIDRLPTPIFNILNGGKHANNNLEFQEFQIIPSSSNSFAKSLEIASNIFHELKRVLIYRNANISTGDEGGFTPNFPTNIDALEVLVETINQKNLKIGYDIFLGLDIASSHFYKDDRYHIKDKPHPLKAQEYIEFIKKITDGYSILVLEDPMSEDDWDSWKNLNSVLDKNIYLVGDDLISANKDRFERAIKDRVCTTILLKPNQIGTISETMEIINLARKNEFNYIISQRSAETNDDFIADFAVGVQSDFVKFGAPARGERVAKYNRMWSIEREELTPGTK